MNHQCYRIVFNKARGMLMVVSEAARSCSKAAGQSNKSSKSSKSQRQDFPHSGISSVRRLTALALSGLMVNVPLLQYAQAEDSQIRADRSARITQQPTILRADNGTPIIDIRAPSGNGVSRNVYSQMDIGDNGAILNNSRFGTNTQLAGNIDGNFWLLFGEAHTIVNEVNSANPMQFNGTLEVAGNTANVIIASPSGITVNGGNLINAQTGTLTTGTINYDRLGNPNSINVSKGQVVIGEKGLNNQFASGVSMTNLLANGVSINGQITGRVQDLVQVVVGENDIAFNKDTYTLDNEDIVSHTKTTPNTQNMALDIGQSGGIYAEGIRLIGTEAGMGVSNAGVLKANNYIELTNNGTIRNSGQISVGNANSTNARLFVDNHKQADADVINTGKLYAGNRVDVHAGRDLKGDGSITRDSNNNILQHIDAMNITAQRDWQVGSLHNTNQAGDIQLVAGRNLNIDQSATLNTKNNLLISAGNDLSLKQTDIQSTGDNKVVGIYSGKNLSLQDTKIAATGKDSTVVNHAGQHQTLTNTDFKADRISQNTPGQLTINQAKLISTGQNSDIKLIAGDGIDAKQLTATATDGAIVLEAAKASLLDTPTSDIKLSQATLTAKKTIDIVAEDDVDVQKAKLNGQQIRSTAGGNLTLDTKGDSTAEQNIYLKAGETLSLGTEGSLTGNHIEALASRIELQDNTRLTAKAGDIKLSATSQNPESDPKLANDINLGTGSNLQAGKDLAISTNNGHIQGSGLTASADSLGMIATDGIKLDSVANNTSNTLTARTGNLTLLNQGDSDVKLTDITATANQGQLTLSTTGEIMLDTRHSTTNQLGGERVRISNQEASNKEQRTNSQVNISNTNITASASDMVIDSDDALTLANSNLTAKGNLELHGDDYVYLENVNTDSQKHTTVSSDTTLSIASSSLTSEGVLSTKSQGNTSLKDTTFTAGALLHHAEKGKIELGDNVNFNAQSSDLLANNPELAAINGSMTLKGAGDLTLDAGHRITTEGQIDLNTKGTLTLKGEGGSAGNGSQTNVQLTAKGNVYLTGGKVIVQGSDITSTAGGIQIAATVGDVELQAIKNDIDGVKPENRIAELNKALAKLNSQINTLNEDSVYQTALTAKQSAQAELSALVNQHQQTPIADFDTRKKQIEAKIATHVSAMNIRVAELNINKTHDELAADKAKTNRSLEIENTPYQGNEYYGTHLKANSDIKLFATGGVAIDAGNIETSKQFIVQTLGQQATGRIIIDEEVRAGLTTAFYGLDKLSESDKQKLLAQQLALVDGMTFSLNPSINQSDAYNSIRNQIKSALPNAVAGDADAQKTVRDLLSNAPPVKYIPVSISIEGLHDIYQRGNEGDDIFSLHNNHRASQIVADQGIILQATGADNTDPSTVTTTGAPNSILLGSGDFIAKDGDISISTVGNLIMQAGQDSIYDAQTQTKSKKSLGGLKKKVTITTTTEDIRSADPVTLVANNIRLNAADSIYGYATEFKAPEGNTIIQAGNAIRLMAVEEVDNKTIDTKKTSSFLGFKYNKDRNTSTRNVASDLPSSIAANIINTQSGDDTQLQGTQFEYLTGADIKAGVGMKAVDDAQIIFETINTSVYEQQTNEFNNVVWQSMSDSGSFNETAELPKFTGPVNPTFSAPGGLLVQVPLTEEQKQDNTNLVNVIDRLSQQQGYAYLKGITTRNDVDFSVVQLAQQEWDYKQEGLTPAGAALLTLAVAWAAGPAAANVSTALGGGTLGAAGGAGFTSLATQASITLVNNKGDIGKTLDDLASSETAKQLVYDMISAGVSAQLNTTVLKGVGNKALQDRLIRGVVQGTGQALVNSAVNGVSLEEALKSSLRNSIVDAGSGFVFTEYVKDLDGDGFVDSLANKIAAGIAGCATAELKNQSCEAGAIGASVGEAVADFLANSRYQYVINENGDLIRYLSPSDQQYVIDTAKLIAGSVAAVSGLDVNDASQVAEIAVINNGTTLEKIKNIPSETLRLIEERVENTANAAREYRTYAAIESQAFALSYLLRLGQKTNSDFIYVEGGVNFGGVKLNETLVINLHNGNAYVPITANAAGNTNSNLSTGVNIGIGQVINVPTNGNRATYTDLGLDGYGVSGTATYGIGSVTYSETADGSVQMLSASIGREIGNSKSSGGLEVGATGMQLLDLSKYNIAYDPAKNLYINTRPSTWNP